MDRPEEPKLTKPPLLLAVAVWMAFAFFITLLLGWNPLPGAWILAYVLFASVVIALRLLRRLYHWFLTPPVRKSADHHLPPLFFSKPAEVAKPLSKEEMLQAARGRFQQRCDILNAAGLEPDELDAGLEKAKQVYLREVDGLL